MIKQLEYKSLMLVLIKWRKIVKETLYIDYQSENRTYYAPIKMIPIGIFQKVLLTL